MFRPATHTDLPFLLDAVLAAERSGMAASAYELVLRLSNEEVLGMIAHVFAAENPNCELCISNFLVLDHGSGPIGCISGWVEKTGDEASGYVKAPLMADFLGMERWMAARPNVETLAGLNLSRTAGQLQLDCVCIAPEHRGRGLSGQLLDAAMVHFGRVYPQQTKAQLFSIVENKVANAAFSSAGFEEVAHATSTDPQLLAVFPGSGQILWERLLPLQP